MQNIITTTTSLFLMEPVLLYFFSLLVWTHSSASHMTSAPQSIYSSWRRCWFTTATCTQDTSSPTAAVLPRRAAPHRSAVSGSGCRTTRYGKPACRRCCLATHTCSSTRECDGQASTNDRTSSLPDRLLPFLWRPRGYPPGVCVAAVLHRVSVLCRSGHSMRLVIPKKKELQDFSQILLAIWATFLVEQFFCNRQQE